MLRRVKHWIFGLSVMAAGILMYVGLGAEMRAEIPWHQEIGIGVFSIGVLLMMALYMRWAMRLFQALLIGALAAFFGMAAFATSFDDWAWQDYALAGLSLVFALNVPIALVGGYDLPEGPRSSLGKDVAEDVSKRGLEELFDD